VPLAPWLVPGPPLTLPLTNQRRHTLSDGVKRVKKTLADGTVRVYEYQRTAEPRAKRRPPAIVGDTVKALIQTYTRSPQYRKLAPNSQRLYGRALREISDAYGHEPVAGIRRRTVRAMVEDFQDTPGIANALLTVWRVLLQRAVDDEWIESNPAVGLKAATMGTRKRWTDVQVRHALSEAPEWLRRAIALALATGQRSGDLVALRWSQYDGEVIRLQQQKTGAELEIPLGPDMRRELSAWRREARTLTVLATVTGLPWKPGSFATEVSEWIRGQPILGGLTFHGLRHTAASRLAEAGATVLEIQAITGHRNLATVARYTRGVDQRVAAASAVRKLTKAKPSR
jgi:integrase